MTLPSLATFMLRAGGVAPADTLTPVRAGGASASPARAEREPGEEWSLPMTEPIVIGLLHPGEMGAAVGRCLAGRGYLVLWASAGRGPQPAAPPPPSGPHHVRPAAAVPPPA